MSLQGAVSLIEQSPATAVPAPHTSRRHATGTHVRAIDFGSKEERHAAALLLTRSFAISTLMRYLGRVKRPGVIPPPTTTSREGVAQLPSNARALYYFFAGMLTTTVLANGRPTVVVEPAPAPTTDAPRDWLVVRVKSPAKSEVVSSTAQSEEPTGVSSPPARYERYLVVAQWLAPGERPDDIMTVLKSKHHRTMTGGGWWIKGWGPRGIWNALKIADVFQERHRAACVARGIKKVDCWTLEIFGTDPEAEGKGYGSLAIREGLEYIERNRPGPCLLETSEHRAKAVYGHFGFEETSSVAVGSGLVDEEGFLLSSPNIKTSTDLTAWTMLRPIHNT